MSGRSNAYDNGIQPYPDSHAHFTPVQGAVLPCVNTTHADRPTCLVHLQDAVDRAPIYCIRPGRHPIATALGVAGKGSWLRVYIPRTFSLKNLRHLVMASYS